MEVHIKKEKKNPGGIYTSLPWAMQIVWFPPGLGTRSSPTEKKLLVSLPQLLATSGSLGRSISVQGVWAYRGFPSVL